jgi:cell division cycle 20, cofactor of APC complex
MSLGTTLGSIQLWDAEIRAVVHEWRDEMWDSVGGMDWRGSVLAVGLDRGAIEFYDARDVCAAARLETHRTKVHGVKFSSDGNFLASSDQQGVVNIWDVRAGKSLSESKRVGGRIRHGAPVKVCRVLVSSHACCTYSPYRHFHGVLGSLTYLRQAQHSQMARSVYSP